MSERKVDVVIVGASLAASACGKRLVDAGFETVVLEKMELPRHKICSGILSPRGHRFLLENFGPLPADVLHDPTSCRGVTFHFPSKLSLSMDFDGGATPHLYRKHSDHWAIRCSGVEIHDLAIFDGFEQDDGGVAVEARDTRSGEARRYRARYLIGADGPNSPVLRKAYPEHQATAPWFMVGQKFHKIIDCPLDEEYFHFWFHPQLGHYTWSHARDGRQIVGVGFPRGGNFNDYHRKVQAYLEQAHDVKLEDAEDSEACVEVFGPSLVNRYVFGKGRVLLTGQAAGFLNMMAEGMSCSMHSGAIAGEAVVEALQHNRPVQQVYRKMIASEVQRCSDQGNPLKIAFARPHEADFRAELKKLPIRDQLRMVGELLNFLRIYSRFNWGRQILGQALYRLFHPVYNPRRWG